ncbi:MAG TPA: hypothetical protein VNG31_03935, partial [Candidatus Baltobacteraceae bacterium]|nr:hypothetical protein [Candidatus Baltobacteraceae bacterium]
MTPEKVVEFAEGLGRVAASGGGAKALAAYLADATGTGVLVEDAQWRHLATAGKGAAPTSARVIVESGAPGLAVEVRAGEAHVGWLSLSLAAGSDSGAEYLVRLTASAIAVELARN